MTDPSEESPASDPQAGRDHKPHDRPEKASVVDLTQTGKERTEDGGHSRCPDFCARSIPMGACDGLLHHSPHRVVVIFQRLFDSVIFYHGPNFPDLNGFLYYKATSDL